MVSFHIICDRICQIKSLASTYNLPSANEHFFKDVFCLIHVSFSRKWHISLSKRKNSRSSEDNSLRPTSLISQCLERPILIPKKSFIYNLSHQTPSLQRDIFTPSYIIKYTFIQLSLQRETPCSLQNLKFDVIG